MVKKVYTSFANLIADDLRVYKVIFPLISVSYLLYALFAANVPLIGFIPHRALNILPSVTAFVFFMVVLFFKPGTDAKQFMFSMLIYEINMIGVYILYATEYMDMYAYQFMVGYVLSTYFFSTRKSLIYFVIIINSGVLITAFTSHAKSSGVFDFYLTYFICQVVFAVLYRYRFMVEEKLLESEKRYRLVAENSFDLICIHDADAKLQFVSPSIKRMLGYNPEDLIGKYPVYIVHIEDEGVMRAVNFKDPSKSFLEKPMQFRLRDTGGKHIWFETIFTLLDRSDSESGSILSQSREITERKKYELALEERTKELERSNADLETFAFVSSHDMQEPLRMISNYTQLLKKRYEGKIDKEAEEYLNFANNGATTLQQLLRDLLSYSRITRADVKRSRVDMNTLLTEVLRNLKLELQEKNAQVICEELLPVEGDKNLLMLVMQNLILNGVKYNQSGKPEIKISSTRLGKEVTYCIEDNGIGIEKSHQQRIFEPFHRLHTKNEYPGTGLGLSICKKIIEKSNGKIWLESEPARGTKFYFSLS
jgi:PAS domain S-box-containing protein